MHSPETNLAGAHVLGESGFGSSYLKNSRLCHQWNCISTKLGLPDSLPSREISEEIFRRALPKGPWQDVIGNVLENCYENRTRRFTNTCPGQALIHCVVDQMIDFCPVSSTRKDDSCSPVASLAGLKYMFSQSRYVNLEKNLPRESRPTWFLKNYFDTKCCDLPVIFNTTVLEECGFSSVMNYFDHGPRYTDVQTVNFQDTPTTPPTSDHEDTYRRQPVFMPSDDPDSNSPTTPPTSDQEDTYRRQPVFMPFDFPDSNSPTTPPTSDHEDAYSRQPVFMPFDFPDSNAATTPAAPARITEADTSLILTPTSDHEDTYIGQGVFMPFDFPDVITPRPPTTPAPTTPAIDEYTTTKRLPEFHFSGMPFDFPSDEPTDPLDCCEMSKFINPSWRSECDFHLSFKGQDRLVIANHSYTTEAPPTTTTERTNSVEDLMLVPHSCQQETCVFQRMGIISDTGILDIDAYIKMLHNFAETHTAWGKASARVLTKCVANPVRSYEAGCEINNMLACTLDVLSENCPYKRKLNVCKHGKYDVSCQISSSKYRPKNRREICLLPQLINSSHLQACGLETLYKVEHVPMPKPRSHGWLANRYTCKDSKELTTCMMTKMGVLNKYNFMDYFKMKDRIRQFTTDQVEWAALQDIYISAFTNIPMYGGHCNSERKLLNVIDAMLMTCPVSKRKNTAQCNRIFLNMTHTEPDRQNVTKEKRDEIMKHYHHVFMPNQPETTNLNRAIRKKHFRTVKKPVYDFTFLKSKEAPPVRVISLKPESTTRKPIIPPVMIKPVYLRPEFGRGPVYDGVFRRNPFWLNNQIAKSQMSTSTTSNSNIYTNTFGPPKIDSETVKFFGLLRNRNSNVYDSAFLKSTEAPAVRVTSLKPESGTELFVDDV